MKKVLFAFALSLVCAHLSSQTLDFVFGDLITLEVRYDHPLHGGMPLPKSPIQAPQVTFDDHTLYIYDVAYDLTLALVDEDDEVVYSVFVPANTSSVVLPSWLEGDYQLLLIPDENYYFAGEISL